VERNPYALQEDAMNAKLPVLLTVVAAMGLGACSPQVVTQVVNQTQVVNALPAPTQIVVQTQVVASTPERVAAATSAPAATAVAAVNYPTPAPTAWSPEPTAYPVPGATPADMNFQNYGVNPFVDAAEDHLSTFALDVDTASYTLARSYIESGRLPPPEAIRPEEFINFFKQDYNPPADVAFGVYADGAPSYYNQDGSYLVRFGVQGYSVPESERQPTHLTFVIDVSGSMALTNRLELVKRSLELLVERLRPSDTIAIVVFGDSARVLLSPTPGNDTANILNAIYSLQPEGATNTEDGLRLGYSVASNIFRPDASNKVILCSDGVANVGDTDPDAILNDIGGYARNGISLSTLGFGMGNFNDVLMEQLADKGNGNYAYIDSIEQAQKMFVDQLTSTLQVIAEDAKVQVDFNPDVVDRYRLVGYENRAVADPNFRNDAVGGGEMGAGHTSTAIYAVILKPGAQGRLATVQMRWADPQTHAVREINGNFNTFDLAGAFEAAAPRYQLAVTVAQFADLLRHSPYANPVSLSAVANQANRLAQGALAGDPDVAGFASLVSRTLSLGALN
jgi:Ca-activated chloride channel family protein